MIATSCGPIDRLVDVQVAPASTLLYKPVYPVVPDVAA